MNDGERINKLRDLIKRMERALGEENVVTLETLNSLGYQLDDNGEHEEAREVYEGCSARQMKVLGEDHPDTLGTLTCLGVVYGSLENYEKAYDEMHRKLSELS